MKKKRFVGIFMMIGSTIAGGYGGIWHLFILPAIELTRTYNAWTAKEVVIDLLKIFIFFPMFMILVFMLWKVGEMLFLDD